MALQIAEVRNDFTDDQDRYTRIDVWETDDDNEDGKVVAAVCQDTGKVYWIDASYQNSPLVMEAINEVIPKTTLQEQNKELLEAIIELDKQCCFVHRHWGDGSNREEATAAENRIKTLISKYSK